MDDFAERVKQVLGPAANNGLLKQYLAPLYYELRPLDPAVRTKLASIDFPQINNSEVDEVAVIPDFYPNRFRTVFLGLLAHVLYQRDIGSVFIYDDKTFSTCKIKDGPVDCIGCMKTSSELTDLMGLNSRHIGELSDTTVDVPPDEREQMRNDAKASVKTELKLSSFNEQKERHRELFEQYLEAGETAWQAAVSIDRELDFEYLVTNIGPGLPKRAVFDYAERQGKNIVGVMDPAYGSGDAYIFNKGERPLAIYMSDEKWEAVKSHPLDEGDIEELDEFMRERFANARYQIHSDTETDIAARIGFDPNTADERVYAMFTHLLWDAAIEDRMSRAFDDHNQWVVRTIEEFRDRSDRLIVKTHPAEEIRGTKQSVSDVLDAEFETLPNNVEVLPPTTDINTYELVDLVDIVLIFSSTVGLESSYMRKPVITVGDSHYTGKGFTNDVDTVAKYVESLDSDPSALRLSDDEHRLALRYAYNYFIERPIDIDGINAPHTGDADEILEIDSYEELLSHDTFERIGRSIDDWDDFFYGI